MDITKLPEWLKLSPRYLFPISLVTGFVLFATTDLLDVFGLSSPVLQYRPLIGVVFLLSTALLTTDWSIKFYEWVQLKRGQSAETKRMKERLHNLTIEEKKVLRGYLDKPTKSQYLSVESGLATGLAAEKIIYRASFFGRLNRWAYNIQPWAWDYLNKHPELLVMNEKLENSPKRNRQRIFHD